MAHDSNSPPASDHSPTTTPAPKHKKSKTANTSVASSRAGTPSINGDSTSKSKGATSATSRNDDGSETQQCKHCKKHVPRDGFAGHSKQCLRDKKQRKRQKEAQAAAAQAEKDRLEGDTGVKDAEGDVAMEEETIMVKPPSILPEPPAANDHDDTGASTPTSIAPSKPLKKSSTHTTDGGASGDASAATKKTATNKKRKADDSASTPAEKPPTKKQKKKEEAASKPKPAPKPKGPVDVEKQCGVLMPNGQMCARSLTCKSHSMGAKRSVPGRSARYDVLLAQYQKKNQARLQKAAIASLAPQVDEFDEANAGPVDSDEERDAVMAGIGRSFPRPLIERPVVSVRQRYQAVRVREMLSQALGGSGRSGASMFRVGPAQRAGEGGSGQDGEASKRSAIGPQQHMRTGSVSAAV